MFLSYPGPATLAGSHLRRSGDTARSRRGRNAPGPAGQPSQRRSREPGSHFAIVRLASAAPAVSGTTVTLMPRSVRSSTSADVNAPRTSRAVRDALTVIVTAFGGVYGESISTVRQEAPEQPTTSAPSISTPQPRASILTFIFGPLMFVLHSATNRCQLLAK